MSPVYAVRHRTRYSYDAPVSASYGQLHMLPQDGPGQRCRRSAIRVEPTPESSRERVDFFGNRVWTFAVHEHHRTLTVTAESIVEVEARAGESSVFGERSWEDVAAGAASDPESCQYLLDSPRVRIHPEQREYARTSFPPGAGVLEATHSLMHRIHADFAYVPGSTSVATSLEEVFARRTGVCQDFAHVGIACLRAMGLPARYVSGYLETDPAPGTPKLTGVDGSHAWLSVLVPDTGWIALDPTNDQPANGRYVTTAVGRDYSDVPPMQGIIYSDGVNRELEVQVDVTAISEESES